MKCSSVLNDENERGEEASNWPSVPLQIAIDGRSPSQYSGECHEEQQRKRREPTGARRLDRGSCLEPGVRSDCHGGNKHAVCVPHAI